MIAQLHSHSVFSFLYGCQPPEAIAEVAARDGLSGIALTDRGGLHGYPRLLRHADERGIKAVAGAEFEACFGAWQGDVVLLAMTRKGYVNLCRAVSLSNLGASPGEIALDDSELGLEGLTILTGGPSGLLADAMSRGIDQGRSLLSRLTAATGRDNVFVELRALNADRAPPAFDALAEVAASERLSTIATTEIRLTGTEDVLRAAALDAMRTGKPVSKLIEKSDEIMKTSWVDRQDMLELFSPYPRALAATEEVARRAESSLGMGQLHKPGFPVPERHNEFSYLSELSWEGAARLEIDDPGWKDRLRLELATVRQLGFSGHFLVVWDLAREARRRGIRFLLRGSGAGSLITHLLGINDVNPLKANLYFERFLNQERREPPDFDLDFEHTRRHEAIAYLKKRYGENGVVGLCNHQTLGPRGALRESARLVGMRAQEANRWCKRLPRHVSQSDEPGKVWERLGSAVKDEPLRTVAKIAEALLGRVTQIAAHAAGVIVSAEDLSCVLPLEKGPDGRILTQYDKDGTKDAGVLKLDILGSRGLTQLAETVDVAGVKSAYKQPPPDDPSTMELVRAGRTIGCLQLESPGMRRLLARIRPDNPDDVIAVLSLYRPGPMEGGMTDAFDRRRRGEEPVRFPHPLLAEVLEDTYGVFLYQEQIMEAARRVAGFSLGEADAIRKGIAKGKGSQLERMRERFLAGCRANGVSDDVAAELFGALSSFAGFAFNKAHSTAYGRVVYEACYLKAHYPRAFLAAILNAGRGYYPPAQYIEEARRLGLGVYGPDVNLSGAQCVVADSGIRIGLGFVKGIGSETAAGIVRERVENGPFTSFFELRQRLFRAGVRLHRDALENMVRTGALDSLGHNRPTCLAWLALSPSLDESPMLSGFELGGNEPQMVDWSPRRKLEEEYRVLGFCPGEHVLEGRMEELQALGVVRFTTAQTRQGKRFRVCGLPVHLRSLNSNGYRSIIGLFEDPSSLFEASFPEQDFRGPLREVQRRGAAILEGIVGHDQSPLRVRDIRAFDLFE